MKISIIRIKLALARINPTKKARYLVIHLILGSFGLLSQKKNSFGATSFASKSGRRKIRILKMEWPLFGFFLI